MREITGPKRALGPSLIRGFLLRGPSPDTPIFGNTLSAVKKFLGFFPQRSLGAKNLSLGALWIREGGIKGTLFVKIWGRPKKGNNLQ